MPFSVRHASQATIILEIDIMEMEIDIIAAQNRFFLKKMGKKTYQVLEYSMTGAVP